jgi:uncharacterized protein
MTLTRHLVIFTRYPMLGTGKRRLAAGIGAAQAVRFQRTRLEILLARHGRDPRWRTWLATTPRSAHHWPRGMSRIEQGQGDLGQRMGRVFDALPPGPAIIMGTDIPGVTSSHISRAFHALGNHHAVFGPATDGGYWLVGLRRRPRTPIPFDNVRWSTPHALADTVANLAPDRPAHVATLADVDDLASLRANSSWCRLCPQPQSETPQLRDNAP